MAYFTSQRQPCYLGAMFRFFLKKSFYDAWDNMFTLVLLNAVFIATVAAGLWLSSLAAHTALRLACLACTALAVSVWLSVSAFALSRAADFKPVRLGDIRDALAAGWLPGLKFGALLCVFLALAMVSLPFYANAPGFVGLFAAGLSFWLFLCLALVMQYMLPWMAANGGTLRGAAKGAFILFLDSPGFALGLALYGLVCVILSPLVGFLLPGPATAMMASCDAVRLRSFKLRWIAGSGQSRAVPWKSLLADDVEALGTRGLKELIFPWKK